MSANDPLDRRALDNLHDSLDADPTYAELAEMAARMLREIERLRDIIELIESGPERERILRRERVRGAEWMRDALAADLRERGFGRISREMSVLCDALLEDGPPAAR